MDQMQLEGKGVAGQEVLRAPGQLAVGLVKVQSEHSCYLELELPQWKCPCAKV